MKHLSRQYNWSYSWIKKQLDSQEDQSCTHLKPFAVMLAGQTFFQWD